MAWHPREKLVPTEYLYPRPGSDQPFAVIRLVEIRINGRPVKAWRAVTYEQPRALIGYWPTLDEAVVRTHKAGIAEVEKMPHPDENRWDSTARKPEA